MVEIRILSGMHRGATLPLDDSPYRIGAGHDADIVLTDSGIEPHHATLWPTKSGWLLTPGQGTVYAADGSPLRGAVELIPGAFLRIGDVWFAMLARDARWTEPPELASLLRAPAAMANEPAETKALAVTIATTTKESGRSAPQPARAKWRFHVSRRVLFVPLAAVAVVSVAAYSMSVKPQTGFDLISDTASPVVTHGVAKAEAVPTAAYVAPSLTPKELRRAFRKQLAAAGLLGQFELSLSDRAWSMRAELDKKEKARFERVLFDFMQEHKIEFPVHATVTNDGSMLPFQIREVVSGGNASVITSDGRRVFLGEAYRGVRLVAIEDDRLVFDGKRKIEMKW